MKFLKNLGQSKIVRFAVTIDIVMLLIIVSVCLCLRSTMVFIKEPTLVSEAECEILFKDDVQYIHDKYGLNVEFVFHDAEYMTNGNKGIKYEDKATKEYIEILFQEIDETLSLYTDDFIQSLPKRLIITSSMKGDDMIALGFVKYDDNHNPIYICLSSSIYKYMKSSVSNIHHELFHTFTAHWSNEQIEEFNSIGGSCSLISDYACSDVKSEEYSETWAYSFKHNDNLKANYLQETYGYILKG